jgi:hypothetical protein
MVIVRHCRVIVRGHSVDLGFVLDDCMLISALAAAALAAAALAAAAALTTMLIAISRCHISIAGGPTFDLISALSTPPAHPQARFSAATFSRIRRILVLTTPLVVNNDKVPAGDAVYSAKTQCITAGCFAVRILGLVGTCCTRCT